MGLGSINSLIYSFAPTVAYFIIPLLSQLTGGYTDIRTYRYIIVPMAVLGVSLNPSAHSSATITPQALSRKPSHPATVRSHQCLFTAFGCKERVVTRRRSRAQSSERHRSSYPLCPVNIDPAEDALPDETARQPDAFAGT